MIKIIGLWKAMILAKFVLLIVLCLAYVLGYMDLKYTTINICSEQLFNKKLLIVDH
jgi:hypothetical protein